MTIEIICVVPYGVRYLSFLFKIAVAVYSVVRYEVVLRGMWNINFRDIAMKSLAHNFLRTFGEVRMYGYYVPKICQIMPIQYCRNCKFVYLHINRYYACILYFIRCYVIGQLRPLPGGFRRYHSTEILLICFSYLTSTASSVVNK